MHDVDAMKHALLYAYAFQDKTVPEDSESRAEMPASMDEAANAGVEDVPTASVMASSQDASLESHESLMIFEHDHSMPPPLLPLTQPSPPPPSPPVAKIIPTGTPSSQPSSLLPPVTDVAMMTISLALVGNMTTTTATGSLTAGPSIVSPPDPENLPLDPAWAPSHSNMWGIMWAAAIIFGFAITALLLLRRVQVPPVLIDGLICRQGKSLVDACNEPISYGSGASEAQLQSSLQPCVSSGPIDDDERSKEDGCFMETCPVNEFDMHVAVQQEAVHQMAAHESASVHKVHELSNLGMGASLQEEDGGDSTCYEVQDEDAGHHTLQSTHHLQSTHYVQSDLWQPERNSTAAADTMADNASEEAISMAAAHEAQLAKAGVAIDVGDGTMLSLSELPQGECLSDDDEANQQRIQEASCEAGTQLAASICIQVQSIEF